MTNETKKSGLPLPEVSRFYIHMVAQLARELPNMVASLPDEDAIMLGEKRLTPEAEKRMVAVTDQYFEKLIGLYAPNTRRMLLHSYYYVTEHPGYEGQISAAGLAPEYMYAIYGAEAFLGISRATHIAAASNIKNHRGEIVPMLHINLKLFELNPIIRKLLMIHEIAVHMGQDDTLLSWFGRRSPLMHGPNSFRNYDLYHTLAENCSAGVERGLADRYPHVFDALRKQHKRGTIDYDMAARMSLYTRDEHLMLEHKPETKNGNNKTKLMHKSARELRKMGYAIRCATPLSAEPFLYPQRADDWCERLAFSVETEAALER